MEEKKKRVRPTVAQVNELKANIVVLEQSIQALKGLVSKKEEIVQKQAQEYDLLLAREREVYDSVSALKEVIERKDKYIHKLEEKDMTLEKENTRLKRRGFWERVFNL